MAHFSGRIKAIILGPVLFLTFLLSHPSYAHNGAVAIAIPVEGIVVDGDFSDWPEGMREYSIELPEYREKPVDEEDFRGSFRIGYNEQENALYIAVEVRDESVFIGEKKDSKIVEQYDAYDGCEVYVEKDSSVGQYVIFNHHRAAHGSAELEDVVLGVQREEGAHRYEWRIEKPDWSLRANQVLGVDVVVADKDADGSFSWMAWGPEPGKVISPDRVGLAILGGTSGRANLTVDIERTETPPVIDGDISEWGETHWIRLARDAPNMPPVLIGSRLRDDGAAELEGTAGTDEDLSGAFTLQWDEEWIYLAAQVADNVRDIEGTKSSEWWCKDGVTLFLDVPLDGDGSDWIQGDHTFSFVADSTYPEDGRWWRNGDFTGETAPPETQLAVQEGENGDYVLEAAIPMAALTEATPEWSPPFEGRIVGFMLMVTDPDGGGTPYGGQLMYGGTSDDDASWAWLRFRPAGMAASPHWGGAEGSGAEAGIGKIRGKITWEDEEETNPQGKVRLQSLIAEDLWVEVRPDQQGEYEVDLPAGAYSLHASGRGVRKQVLREKVEVDAGEEVAIDAVLDDLGSCFFVDDDAAEGGDGSRDRPFRTIREAMESTGEGDTVKVAAGTYTESVELLSGVTLLGAGPDSTFIDGEGQRGSLVQIVNVQDVVLEGFAIVRGKGINLPISRFYVEQFGGLYISRAQHARITRNLIAGNISAGDGGGIASSYCDSTVVIAHNLIVGNESLRTSTGWGGGGIYLGSGTRARVENNTVVYNRTGGSGGGIYCSNSSPYLHGNIVAFNINGGIAFDRSSGMSPEEIGPGPRLTHNLVWGNTGGDYLGLEMADEEMSVDPQFADPERGDFRLASSSPARGLGAAKDALPQSSASLGAATPPGRISDQLRQQSTGAVGRVVRLVDVVLSAPRRLRIDTVEIDVEPLDLELLDLQEKIYDRSSGLPGSAVRTAMPAPDGSIWFGMDQGAARYDGLWTYLDTADGLLDNEVREILTGADSTVWIATRKGMVRIRDGRVKSSEPIKSISHLIPDPDGGIWVGCYYERPVHLDSARIEYAFADSAGQVGYGEAYPLFVEDDGTTWWIMKEDPFDPSDTGIPLLVRYDPDGVRIEAYELIRGMDTDTQQLVPGPGGFWLTINEISWADPSGYPDFSAKSVAFLDTAATSLRVYRLPAAYWKDYQYRVISDKEGILWLFGGDQIFLQYDGKRWRGIRNEAFSTFAPMQDTAGDFWFANASDGAVRYGSLAWTTFEGEDQLKGEIVDCVAEDRQGNLWFGGQGGLAQRQKDGGWSQPAAIDTFVGDLLVDHREQIWAAAQDGIHRFDGERWTRYGAGDGLPDTEIFDLVEGPHGQIWAGTSEGLFCFRGQAWEEVEVCSWGSGDPWESPRRIHKLLCDAQGRLWILTGNGLYVHDGKGVKDYYEFFYPQRNIHLDDLFALEEPEAIRRMLKEQFTEEEDLAWFVAKVKPQYGSPSGDSAALRRVKTAYQALYDGDPEFQSLVRRTVEEGYVVERYSQEESDADPEWQALVRLGGNSFSQIFTGTDGALWFATFQGLFSHQEGEWLYRPVSFLPVLPYEIIASHIDPRGHLWLATGQGAARYDGQEWVLFDVGDGLADNQVRDVLGDGEGNIWFATDKGITRYRPDGRPPQTRVLRGPDGRVGHGTEGLTFQFEGGDWESERRVTFSHALVPVGQEPEGTDWSAWSGDTFAEVSLEDLRWGAFTFHVRARDRALNVDPTPATWPVIIAAPLWAKGWFQVSVSLGLVLLVFSSTFAVRKQRQARRAERALMQDMEEELQTAHTMQMGLMPAEPPRIEGFDVAGRCIPANHVGGDFFQYFQQDGKLSACMADVTGHAMEAAIPVVMFNGILESQMELGGTLEELFVRLNRSLYRTRTDSRTFVCFAMGEFDSSTRVLRLSNGGCPYPLHYRATTRTATELQVDAYPLGVRAESAYSILQVHLEAEDRIVFCSDGIAEAAKADEEIFGFERTAETIRQGCVDDLSAEALIDRLVGAVKDFAGDAPQGDDMTVVVIGLI